MGHPGGEIGDWYLAPMASEIATTPVSEVDFGLDLGPDDIRLPGAALHRELARIRRAHRLAPVNFGGIPMQLVTRFADVEACFRDDEGLPAGPTYAMTVEPCQGVTFESLDGDEHHALRDLTTRGLRRRPVERYAQAGLADLCDSVIDRFADRGRADLVASFTSVFPFLVFADRMGLPFDAADRFMGWAFDILSYPIAPEAGLAAAAELTEYLEPVLETRHRAPTDDLLSSMCTASRSGRTLTDEEIRNHVLALFSAGATTTYHGLGNTLFALLTHRGAVGALRNDNDLVHAAIDEMLRWEPPLALLPRLASRDVEVAGFDVPAGTMLLFGIASANRDPDVHERPDEFDIGRQPTRVLTFGLGSHHCPGSHLAKAQIAIAVQRLLDRLPELCLADPASAAPTGTVMRGPRSLEVTWRT
jgi:cytochrome P450